MEKIIQLHEVVKDDNGNKIADLNTWLEGDGSTPVIQTMGHRNFGVIGYSDDGLPIIRRDYDHIIKKAETKFMAEAIKEQKAFCEENGVDPNLVNIINAERELENDGK